MDVVTSFLSPISYVAVSKLFPSLSFSFLIYNMKKLALISKVASSYNVLLGFQMVTDDDKILCQLVIMLCKWYNIRFSSSQELLCENDTTNAESASFSVKKT